MARAGARCGRAVPCPRPDRAVPGRVEPRVSVRELDQHGAGESFPTSRMPASVEISIKLIIHIYIYIVYIYNLS